MVSPWRQQLSGASYKGVPFFTDSHTLSGGRRIVDHIFPYLDKAFTEDLGQKQNIFTIEAYILGEDYFRDRDRLLDAITKEGAGILVHPFLGEKVVEAVDFTLNETTTEGGIARFSLTFHETSRQTAPVIDQDLVPLVKDASMELDDSLVSSFTDFSVNGLTLPGITAATAFVDQGTAALQKAASLIPQTDFGISELGYSLRILKATGRDLIRAPLVLARYIVDSTELLSSTLNADRMIPTDAEGRELTRPDAASDFVFNSKEKRKTLLPLMNYAEGLPQLGTQTPSKQRLSNNRRIFSNLIVASAIGKYAVTAASSTYETLNDALADRDFIVNRISKVLEDPLLTDRTFQALQDLMALVVQAVPSPFSQPKRISKVSLSTGTPSIVLAYDLYEGLEMEEDLILRNRVANPSNIPVGTVEVLSGG